MTYGYYYPLEVSPQYTLGKEPRANKRRGVSLGGDRDWSLKKKEEAAADLWTDMEASSFDVSCNSATVLLLTRLSFAVK